MKTLIVLLSLCAGSAFAATNAATSGVGSTSSSTSTSVQQSQRPATPSPYGTVPSPASGDRATTYPESSTTSQTTPPTTREIDRQREQMNQRQEQMRSQADCASITDVQAKAKCEARTR